MSPRYPATPLASEKTSSDSCLEDTLQVDQVLENFYSRELWSVSDISLPLCTLVQCGLAEAVHGERILSILWHGSLFPMNTFIILFVLNVH